MAWTVPYSLLGLSVQGDVGDVTIYSDKYNRKIVYPKAPPKEPASAAQINRRNRFRAAMYNWMLESREIRQAWTDAVRSSGCAITPTGLWVSVSLLHNTGALATISRQTGIELEPPPFV